MKVVFPRLRIQDLTFCCAKTTCYYFNHISLLVCMHLVIYIIVYKKAKQRLTTPVFSRVFQVSLVLFLLRHRNWCNKKIPTNQLGSPVEKSAKKIAKRIASKKNSSRPFHSHLNSFLSFCRITKFLKRRSVYIYRYSWDVQMLL